MELAGLAVNMVKLLNDTSTFESSVLTRDLPSGPGSETTAVKAMSKQDTESIEQTSPPPPMSIPSIYIFHHTTHEICDSLPKPKPYSDLSSRFYLVCR